jgi:hypothetical protein
VLRLPARFDTFGPEDLDRGQVAAHLRYQRAYVGVE